MKFRSIEEFEREMDRRDARRAYGFEREGMSREEMQERKEGREANENLYLSSLPEASRVQR